VLHCTTLRKAFFLHHSTMGTCKIPYVRTLQKASLCSASCVGFQRYTMLPVVMRRHCCCTPATIDQYLLPTGRSAANPPHVAATVDRWDRQMGGRTDGQTDRHRPCSAYYVGSVIDVRCQTDDWIVRAWNAYGGLLSSSAFLCLLGNLRHCIMTTLDCI